MESTPKIIALILAHIVSLCFVAHVLLTKRDPRSALCWSVALVFLPVFGLGAYLVFGIGRAQSRAEKIMRRIADIEIHFTHRQEKIYDQQPEGDTAKRLAALGARLTASPLCPGNKIQPLHNGDQAYPAMLEAINHAKKHVFLSSYIFNYGHAAREFINALDNAMRRGVDVRVLVDGVGALYSWRKPWRILKKLGVKTTRFRPPSLFPPNFGINLRSHRKVLVCDDIGFMGGMNIADGNLLNLDPQGAHHIQDMQFRCEGPIVNQIRQAFLLNWGFCTDEITDLPELPLTFRGESFCRIVVDGPGNDGDALNDLICGALDLSRKSVRIMTPYFLPPEVLMGSLRSACQRGVDVRIILPAKNNLGYINWAMERILPALISAGARVWYQKPPFAHTKLFAVDDFYCLVGSANLDSRSLLLNFELNMEIYDPAFHDALATFMDTTIASGEELTMDYFKKISLPHRLRNAASWIFSPYF